MKKTAILLLTGLLFAGLLFPCLTGCKKKSENPYLVIPQDLRDCLVYDTGSYWVFDNENLGDADSSYLKTNPLDIEVDEGFPGLQDGMERCRVTYAGSFLDSVIILHDDFAVYFDGGFRLEGSEAATFQAGYSTVTGKDTIMNVSVNTSVSFNGNSFDSVCVLRYSTQTNDGFPDIYTAYFKKHTGLIKIDRHVDAKDYVWSLMRWHAVQ
jgi:hypothetical protein